MVEGGGLENRCAARYRGFESPLLRKTVKIFITEVHRVIKKLTAMKKAVLFGAVREWPNRAPC